MQREIKFRCWDGKDMKEDQESKYWLSQGFDIEPQKHFMQYTGMKDKNGKEIYEGDIVRNENDTKPNQQIIFAKGMFCLDDENSPLWQYAPQDFWGIIGNIYENPELLTNY